jgi:CHAT domain-containing protein
MNLEVLALSAVQMGDEKEAKRLALELEDVSRPFIGGRMWGWMKNNALSRVYMSMGHYKEALSYIPDNSPGMKVIVSFVNGLGPYAYRGDSTTTVIEIPRLVMRGKALEETGKLAESAASFDEVLALPRIKDMGDLYWIALFERGRVAEADKQSGKAEALYKKAIDIVELQRSTIKTEGSKIGFVGDKQALYARLIHILIDEGKDEEALDYVERSKSRALVDLLSTKNNFFVPGTNLEKTQKILAQLDVTDLPVEVSAGSPDGGTSSLRNLTVARQQIQTEAPELASLVSVSKVTLSDLKALIGQDEVLVEYYYHGKDLYAFVLNRERLQVIKLNAVGLEANVRKFREVIEEADTDAWRAPAEALYQQLWQPLDASLTAKNVIVVAHGVLHYLPFAALPRPDGSFLLDHYGMRYLPSASVLKYLRPAQSNKDPKILVLGNPDLGNPKFDLQFAEGEARSVAGLFNNSSILVRKDASETNFKKVAAVFSRIHFATHGKFQADDPLSSGLYLAKDAENDGVLTVGELYSINLDADLVTLSACETGLGKVANGDDVVGLTRGFLYAGSRSIVASLWSVDDNATSELMKAFYRNLASMNKEEALRAAQLTTRQSFSHPFFWGAFQLTGRAN